MKRPRFAWLALVLAVVFAVGWYLLKISTDRMKPAHHQKRPPTIHKDGDNITVILDVAKIDQQGWSTCWAACGEMVLDYLGPARVPVCEQAAHNLGLSKDKCCQANTLLGLCDTTGYPKFPLFGNAGTVENLGTPLAWDAIVQEIEVEWRPICYAYPVEAGSVPGNRLSHMKVIIGYQIQDGVKLLLCLNPVPRDPTVDQTLAFGVYEGLGAAGFGHDRDFWKIKP